jgi:hypothetical protein
MKVYFKTRQLLKNSEKKIDIFNLFKVMIQENDGVVNIL